MVIALGNCIVNIEIAWLDDNKTAIVYTFRAGWSWNDFAHNNKIATEMLDGIDHKADIILDFSARTVPPPNALSNFQRMMREAPHPKQGRLILVGARILFRTIAKQFVRLVSKSSQEILVANSLDEAREMVELQHQKNG